MSPSPCPPRKAPIGSGRSLHRLVGKSPTNYPNPARGSEVRRRLEREAMNIIRSSSPSDEASDFQPSERSSPVTGSSQEVGRLRSTSGRTTPESLDLSLNWDSVRSTGQAKRIGKPYAPPPSPGISSVFPQTSTLNITLLCGESLRIILNRLQWNGLAQSSGVQLALASHGELGTRPAWTLTVKIPFLSGKWN